MKEGSKTTYEFGSRKSAENNLKESFRDGFLHSATSRTNGTLRSQGKEFKRYADAENTDEHQEGGLCS